MELWAEGDDVIDAIARATAGRSSPVICACNVESHQGNISQYRSASENVTSGCGICQSAVFPGADIVAVATVAPIVSLDPLDELVLPRDGPGNT